MAETDLDVYFWVGRLLEAIAFAEEALIEWNAAASETQDLYRNLAKELTQTRKNVNISRIVGSSTSLIGVPVQIMGAALLPVSLGTSAILIGVGAGISFTGGLIAGGATLTEKIKKKAKLKTQLSEPQNRLKRLTDNLAEYYTSLRSVLSEGAHQRLAPNIGALSEESVSLTLASATVYSSVAALAKLTITNTDEVAKPLLATGGKFGNAVGTTVSLSVNCAAIDIYAIVSSSYNMSKGGNTDSAIEKLLESVQKIDDLRTEVQSVMDRAKDLLNGDAKAILEQALDIFRCRVCLEKTSPPLLACPSCNKFLGCEKCFENDGSCFTCLLQQWPLQNIEQRRVTEVDELLEQLLKYA